MKETEVKILEINRRSVEERLTKLGAKKVFDGDFQTLFLDFQDGKIAKAKNVLRLRKEKEKVELTYKKVNFDEKAKNAEELSVEVSNLKITLQIFANIGLNVKEDMLKHRVSYELDDAHFDIDRYLGKYGFIPELLEIEAKDVERIYALAELLGYKREDCLPWSTKELIEHYSNKKEKAT